MLCCVCRREARGFGWYDPDRPSTNYHLRVGGCRLQATAESRSRSECLRYVPDKCITFGMDRYAKNAGAVFALKYHIVWCPKYRRPVLVEPIDVRLKEMLAVIASDYGMTIRALEVMPDHVHMFVEADPTRSVAEIVNRFKGRTSRELRIEFPSLRSRLPTLWSRSYFAATTGAVSQETIRRYIEAQKGR